MFRGSNTVNLDAKGRMALPARVRERIDAHCNGHLVATIETEERCLLLYPLPEWERVQTDLEALPGVDPKARRMQRLLIGHATDLEADSAGRILIPPMLREYASLEKKLVLVGQGQKLEIWDEALWYERREVWIDEAAPTVAESAGLQTLKY